MRRTIKPDVAPGEFKCRTCEVMWSSFMESNISCTDTYTIMIRDDEENILTLYTDYLSNMGHRTQSTYVNADSILRELVSSPRHLHHRL